MTSASTITPSCPRCGYDQSGEVARWESECPLQGRCVECGLDFEWRHVCRTDLVRLEGFVEHAPPGLPVLTSAWKTAAWTILPHRFWRRVRMEHTLVPRRWKWWLLAVILAPYLLTCVFLTGCTLAAWLRTPTAPGTVPPGQLGTLGFRSPIPGLLADISRAWTWPVFERAPWAPLSSSVPVVDDWPSCFWPAAMAWPIMPLLLLLLSDTRRIAKIRAGHIGRAAVYSLAPFAVLPLLWLARAIENNIQHFPSPVSVFRYEPGWSLSNGLVDKVYSTLIDYWLPISMLLLLWLAFWWWTALRIGLRLHRAGLVWSVLMIPLSLTWAISVCLVIAGVIGSRM